MQTIVNMALVVEYSLSQMKGLSVFLSQWKRVYVLSIAIGSSLHMFLFRAENGQVMDLSQGTMPYNLCKSRNQFGLQLLGLHKILLKYVKKKLLER